MQVQSVRSVKGVRGYSYWAWGVYERTARINGTGHYWRLVRSGPKFRSDVYERTAFDGIEKRYGIRHGTPCE